MEYLAQAKAMALKALEMDDTLAEAHTSLAYARWLGDLDWSGAEREFKRALELKSSYVMAHEWYAEYLAALGRHDEALAEIKQAQQLDPLSVPVNRAVGWILYFARRYDLAIEELRKALAMDPGFPRRPPGALVGVRREGSHTSRPSPISGRRSERPGLRTLKKLMLAYARRPRAIGRRPAGSSGSWSPSWRATTGWPSCRRCCSRRWTRRTGPSSSWIGRIDLREPGLLFLEGRARGLDPCGRTRGTARWWRSWGSADRAHRPEG